MHYATGCSVGIDITVIATFSLLEDKSSLLIFVDTIVNSVTRGEELGGYEVNNNLQTQLST